MKTKLLILFLLLVCSTSFAQNYYVIDSLKMALQHTPSDSARYYIMRDLSYQYKDYKYDSSLYYAEQEISIADKNNLKLMLAWGLIYKGYSLRLLGNYPESYKMYSKAFEIAENSDNESRDWYLEPQITPHKARLMLLQACHFYYGHLMGDTKNPEKQLIHYKEAERLARELNNEERLAAVYVSLAFLYLRSFNELDTALQMGQKALFYFTKIKLKTSSLGSLFRDLGEIHLRKNQDRQALEYFHKSVRYSLEAYHYRYAFYSYTSLANFYLRKQNRDSSLYYSRKMGDLIQRYPKGLPEDAAELYYYSLSRSYELNNQPDSAFKYLKLAYPLKDSTYKSELGKLTRVQSLSFEEMLRAEQLEKENTALQNRIRQYALLGGLALVLLVAFFLYRSNQQKQKANVVLETAYTDLDIAHQNLKSTQAQLIQSEKMASLGELTAGIAHEIQNPLNFVNNYSEVNVELIVEIKEEVGKGNYSEISVLLNDLAENEAKIHHHGQRADAIVRSMMQHSRTNSGTKEPTNLNALADEYLRLAYQSLRAKDSEFEAEFSTDFEETLPMVNVVQQDIGRALLNIINNAFQATEECRISQNQPDYTPKVKITTKNNQDSAEICILDNGWGIPASIKDKIFQPFFTTRPTGQGTGLGLSLAYDIVKAHGGELRLFSTEGEGTEFCIELPITTQA